MTEHTTPTESLILHEHYRGKWAMQSRAPIESRHDLALAYTPGVADPCKRIAENPAESYRYTSRGNTVAVISNGTSVLGLGNIGPLAAMPVMEGKSILFKRFANIDSIPIVINETNPEKLAEIIRSLSYSFGGINLEDIRAPDCFTVESLLQDIGIPVVHDDQHGTAIVVLAGILNAVRVVNKQSVPLRIVISGAGAAGTAIAKLLIAGYERDLLQIADIIVCDSHGIITQSRYDLNDEKRELAMMTNMNALSGSMNDACRNADIIIGVSRPNGFTADDIAVMSQSAIVFALANPTPEIMPDLAIHAGASIVATGRSDFPNQVNNVLAFPGLFRALLDQRITILNDAHQLAAARAIASLVPEPATDHILPDIFDDRIVPAICHAIAETEKQNSW